MFKNKIKKSLIKFVHKFLRWFHGSHNIEQINKLDDDIEFFELDPETKEWRYKE